MVYMLTLRESKFIDIIEDTTKRRGRTFSKDTINYMCTSARLRSYQVCFKLYKDGYIFS